ncbi:MAG: DUF2207 domain-containing protein [Candidatus Bipolaricaulia bacterium]
MVSLLVAIVLSALAPPTGAQSQTYAISSYDVTLKLQTDGTYLVTEEIAYDFQQGSFSYGTRWIPTDQFDELRNVQVTSPDARILETTTRTEDDRTVIRWTFPERSEPATFTLSYTVHGALIEDGDVNRINWQAVGEETTVPVSNVAMSVRIPDSLDLDQADLDFQPQDEGRIRETSEGYAIHFEHAQLDSGEGYQIIVKFPKRLEGRPPQEVNWALVGAVGLAFLIAILPSVVLWRRWRGPRHETHSAEEPDVPLAQAGVLLKGPSTEAQRAIPAMLYDLASRGHITLTRTKQKKSRFARERPVVHVEFHQTRDDLSDMEAKLLDELHAYESLTEFGRKGNRTRRQLLSDTRLQLVEQGDLAHHRRRSNRVWIAVTLALILGIVVSVLGGGWWFIALGLGIGLFLSGMILAGVTHYTLTEQGAKKRARVDAYLDHLLEKLASLQRHDPIGAAQFFIDQLPWLALHKRVWSKHMDEIKEGLKEADAEDRFEMPPWLQDHTAEAEKGFAPAYASFAACYAVIGDTGGAAAAGAAGGAASAGAGAAGGAGGGGAGAG